METKTVTLDDLVDFYIDNRGKTVPTVDKSKEYLPLIATNCITDDHLYPQLLKTRSVDKDTYDTWFRAHLQPGDILFVNKGTPGKVAMVPEPVNFVAAQDMVGLRIKPEYDTKYVFALLKSSKIRKRIDDMQVGTLIPHFKKSDFSNLKIKIIVDKNYQRKIGSLYFDIFNKQYFNQQINKNLLKVCRLQFDKFKQACSATTELSNIATLIMGQSPKGDTYNQNGEGTPLLNGAADFRGGINPSKYTSDPKKVTEPGDYVFGVRATIGLTTKVFNRYAIGRGTGLARALSYKSDELLYFIMEDAFSYFARASTGSVYLNVSRREFETYAAPNFSNITIKQFHEFASPLMQQIYQNQEQNEELTRLRELLLPRLLSGDIDLSNIETVMNNA